MRCYAVGPFAIVRESQARSYLRFAEEVAGRGSCSAVPAAGSLQEYQHIRDLARSAPPSFSPRRARRRKVDRERRKVAGYKSKFGFERRYPINKPGGYHLGGEAASPRCSSKRGIAVVDSCRIKQWR